MPVVTDTPILIDAINFSTGPAYELTPTLVQRGSALYQILISYDTVDPTLGTLHAFKSTDGGVTWAEQDSAGTPDPDAQSGYFYTFDDAGRDAIDVLYENGNLSVPGTSLTLCTFDTATDTWGTPGAAFDISTIPGSTNIIRYSFYKQSGGPWVVIRGRVSFGPTVLRLFYITFDGVTWSGPTNLTTTNSDGEDTWGGRLQSNGVFHFLATEGGHLLYYQLSAALVLSTKVVLTPPNAFFNSSFPSADMSMTLWDADSIAIGYISTSGTVEMRVGTPLSAPVFTSYVIDTNSGSEAFYYARPIVDANGDLNVFWILRDASIISPLVLSQIFQSAFDGVSTWSAPVLFYDAIDNPPDEVTPGFEVTLLHKFDAIQLVAGEWIAFTTMGGISDEFANIGFILLSSPSQSLRLVKTVSGGSALPAMWLLTGTGPTQTVSAAGDTGVVEVTDPQTFELEESTGPDGYTAGQWDCGDAVMPSPTSVIVDESGTTTVSAVQVSTDATFRTLLSGGDSQFTVGANQYRVMFNSALRLGMFKRATASIGGAWTEMDAAGAPTGQSGYGHSLVDGTTISVAMILAGNLTMKIVEFNTATDLWGTPTAAVTLPSTLATFAFVRRSDNTYVVVGAWSGRCYYILNTAGAWGAVTNIINPGGVVLNGVIDSSDRIWFLFNSTSVTVLIYQLSASYVLSASFGTVTVLFPGPPYPYIYYPQIALWGADAVAVAWNTALTIGGAGTISTKTLTPLAAPVVTTAVAYTFGAGTERAFLFQPVDDGTGDLYLFLVDTDTGVNQILQALFDGVSAWGATSAFYDAVTDPPPSGIVPSDISALQAKKLAAGWTAAVTMQTTGPSSTGEFIESVTPTGVVVCTITNTFGAPPFTANCPSPIYIVGTPYSSFVTVSGGVPPYTFAVLSGSLPTGLSLNAATGEISGTPSADGPFNFVIRVTDDDGATADTSSCSAGRCPGSVSLL